MLCVRAAPALPAVRGLPRGSGTGLLVFLKRIVLHGFKSFADRTELEFGAGITAVVGPNGCGKSNLLDAVRWVLGEQSARSLRGGKMSDVIFSGSLSRKPANFAEVQLTFDNRAGALRSDQPVVTVGRILYRSGESEYRLNGQECRLKDIRDLFLDTGVGVNAYSVIEQGQVDRLLAANPLERREIFEEAAGISRYKVRRIEAQRKLERTQQNLLRLHDILDELERRLRSVRLAAGKARNWQQYDQRLRELRSASSLAEYHELEQTRVRLQREADTLSDRLQAERAQLAARDAEAAELEHARQALDDEIQAADAELLATQTALSTLAERIAQGERRLPEAGALGERRRMQAAEAAERLAEQQQRIANDEDGLSALRAAEQQAAARIAALQETRRVADMRAGEARQALEREKIAAFEAARQGALLRNERENRVQQRGRLAAQVERLDARQREIDQERDELAVRAGKLAERVARLDEQTAGLAAEVRADEQRLAGLQADAERLDEEVSGAKEQRSAILSRLALLEDLERRLEGVDEGTRAVLAWRDASTGEAAGPLPVVGLVADLLRIDDPRVGLLQTVLAAFEAHVVVRDTTAFLAELGRRGRPAGPVRVLALDRLPAPPPITYAHAPGFVACAADWVSCAAEFRPLAEHLLGRVFVVETLAQALRLAGEALSGCVFVTLAGETVAADGRLTLGSGPAAGGLMSRKAEIRQLRGECEEVEGRLVRLTRQRMEVEAAVSDAQLHKQGLLERIAAAQREHAEARGEQGRVHDAAQRLEREAGLLRDERAGVHRGLDELAAQLAALAAEHETVTISQQGHEQRIAGLEAALAGHEAELLRLAQACTEALVERGRAAEKRTAAEQAVAEQRLRAAALEREVAVLTHEAEEMSRRLAAAAQELEVARVEYAARGLECAQRQAEVGQLREARQQLRLRQEECGAAARELQRAVEGFEGELHARRVELREAEVRQEGLVGRVRDELGVDLAALYGNYRHTEQDWEAIRGEMEELRAKMARLGNVNLDAIAELEELTPRYEHLAAQRSDLTEAIRRLESLIAELDRESQTRFSAAVEEIRSHFQEMFRKLFRGGKADIVLQDPEQPLECGIEIVARPPGKEPQTLTLLSGGEKTLTVVALLMGVFRSRPSPFAILDEVDAALDEANVDRFNSVLQEFLSQTQFVVITHSKRTMASADVLYGVTMEEPGVSKRVSVRFEDRVRTPSVA